jgi:hypothetical protein
MWTNVRDLGGKVASGMRDAHPESQPMSYVHCSACQRAYNHAVQPVCPYCPVAATVVDPADDIVAAADQLARALARATPAERAIAAARLPQLAIQLAPPPAPIAKPPTLTLAISIAGRLGRRVIARYAPAIVARVRALAA